jgi:hypothetical protein
MIQAAQKQVNRGARSARSWEILAEPVMIH